MLDGTLAKRGISLEEIMGIESIKHEFCTRKFKLFGNFDVKMWLLCFMCGTIKEKLGLDPRKRIRACQLMWGQRLFC